jgi:integrase/recombinase XerD
VTRLDPSLISAELVHIGGSSAPRHELLAMAWIAGQRSPRTRYSYTGIARRWFEWLAANGVDPLDVARVHVELYQRRLEQLNRKPGTIALYLTALSSFYAYCVDEGVLTKNPVDRVKRPSTGERLSNDRQWLSRPQMYDLLEGAKALGPTEHALLCALGLNGLRIAEACSLNVEHLERRGDYTAVTFVRKGGKIGNAVFARRTEIAVLEAAGDRREGPLFLHGYGGRMNQKAAQRIIDKAMRNVRGEHGRITPHSLRHSCFTLAAQAGVPLDQIRNDGGWADLRTPGIYLHGRNNPAAHSTHAVSALVEGAS